jgi:molybdopterin-guanine dinucleotide biosynthesis protein A
VTPPVSEARSRPGSGQRPPVTGTLGVVFCGGASRRMGRDKAGLLLEGRTLLERALAVLDALVPEVVLASGAAPRNPELGRACLLDEEAGVGPLAGLAAALAHAEGQGMERICVLACDMPAVTPEVLRGLLARAGAAEVCLLATEKGLEPLCGVYHVRALPAVRAALARGARRMDSFHAEVRVERVPEAELAPGCARNLNTPEDYEDFSSAGGRP